VNELHPKVAAETPNPIVEVRTLTMLEKLQNNHNALGLIFMLPAAVLLLLFLTSSWPPTA
jgi:hypothetical protein